MIEEFRVAGPGALGSEVFGRFNNAGGLGHHAPVQGLANVVSGGNLVHQWTCCLSHFHSSLVGCQARGQPFRRWSATLAAAIRYYGADAHHDVYR